MKISDFPNAGEACQKISSKADEIRETYKGAKGLADSIWGLFSPNNYRSEAEAIQSLRNISNIDLSSEEVLKIKNTCQNSFSGIQVNSIDLTKCDYCQKNGCPVRNVTQENLIQNEQKCVIQSLTEILLKKADTVESLATAKILQESQGLASSNSNSDICNVVNKDLSSSKMSEQISQCANQSSMEQRNEIVGCGPVLDIIQTNAFKNFQECLMDAQTKTQEEIKTDTKLSSTLSLDLKSVNTIAFGASSLVILLCILSILLLFTSD